MSFRQLGWHYLYPQEAKHIYLHESLFTFPKANLRKKVAQPGRCIQLVNKQTKVCQKCKELQKTNMQTQGFMLVTDPVIYHDPAA